MANITYQIVNYPAEQAGRNVLGSITTNGKQGMLREADLVDWSVNYPGIVTFHKSEAGSANPIVGEVIASPTEITIAIPDGPVTNNLFLGISLAMISWQKCAGTNLGIYGGIYVMQGNLWNYTGETLGGNDPWVIAKV
jgi:hypothetical protein